MTTIENKFKTLDAKKPFTYFNKLFHNKIDKMCKEFLLCNQKNFDLIEINGKEKKNLMCSILYFQYNFKRWTFPAIEDFEKSYVFIEFLERELNDIGQSIFDIDICLHYLKTDNKLKMQKIEIKKILRTSMVTKFYFLLIEHILLRLSSLFESNNKDNKTLSKRYNFQSFFCDVKKIENNQINEHIKLCNTFIDIISGKINAWRKDILNTYKHNFSDDALDKLNSKKIQLQELFNLWYILYAFILPMLKLPYHKNENKICYQSIKFDNYIEQIYKLLK